MQGGPYVYHFLRRAAKFRFGGPDGGNGGCGGSVIFIANLSVKTLAAVRTHYRGQTGGRGQGALLTGKRGDNVVVKVSLFWLSYLQL